MAKKIKQKKTKQTPATRVDTRGLPPLNAVFHEIAGPVLDRIGGDPVSATMTWAMHLVAQSWNASRRPLESEGLADLERNVSRFVTPAFSDATELAAIMEEIFHSARVRYPRDPRWAVKVFVERRGPGNFAVEVVAGVPQAKR